MSAPTPTITPDLLFAALLVAEPLPAVMYAVRTPYADWTGPSWLVVADSVSPLRSEAERHLTPGDVLVSGLAGTDLHTWEVSR
ncbi:hypothetical protein [Streptomyces sp. NBC_01565]|uniref:hypothetical protein n=1 Tax=Streptomyces sp. NBC_01565 TaxID=2975881 RepID=UPI0022597F62|nr:hypothetical protein [Streptomyces sp. NBC_01565]MCX4543833.1 hypothetical protein [Streptomyces sp. NBC_01565]